MTGACARLGKCFVYQKCEIVLISEESIAH